jgi:hypothetical protein
MKKVLVFLLITVFLSSCSMTVEQLFLISTPTLPPTRIPSNTPTDIPTSTPTVPTLTYTPTPTLLGFKSATPTPQESFTPTAFTPLHMITPHTFTPSVVMEGFISVFTSSAEFYKKGCEPGTVTITGQVAKPLEVNFVVLFVRFKSKLTGNTSEWTSIGMQSLSAGTYSHVLRSDEMKDDDLFKNAWVEYQMVATNLDAREKGRTAIFSEKLTLLDCTPTLTPTVNPTATVLKP